MVLPVFDAIQRDDRGALAALLDGDPKLVEAKDSVGRTPLHWAAQLGRREIVDLLLERKAKIKAKQGLRSAVHWAAMGGYPELAKHLLDRGAPLNFTNSKGWSALHEALYLGGVRKAMILVELGAEGTKAGTHYGKTSTPLHLLAVNEHPDHFRIPDAGRRIARALLKQGADPDALDSDGESPLHLAAQKGKAELVSILLDAGADLERRSSDGAPPLFYAVLGGHLGTVRLLLDRGADLDVEFPEPAAETTGALGQEVVAMMRGQTPLGIALRFGHRYVARLLRERGAGKPEYADPPKPSHQEVMRAAWRGDVGDLRAIVHDDPAEARVAGTMGFVSATALHWAATAGQIEAVRLLLERGAPLENDRHNCYTPLHSACVRGDAAVVRVLLESGADPNQNAGNRPPLHETIFAGWVEVVRALLDGGADPNVLDDRGRTPLRRVLDAGLHGISGVQRYDDLVRDRAVVADLLRAHCGHE